MSWPDHFSAAAEDYARHRPDYPAELFDYLAELCRQRQTACDCATGNGQAATHLHRHLDTGIDALAEFMPRLRSAWGTENDRRSVRWSLPPRLARVGS